MIKILKKTFRGIYGMLALTLFVSGVVAILCCLLLNEPSSIPEPAASSLVKVIPAEFPTVFPEVAPVSAVSSDKNSPEPISTPSVAQPSNANAGPLSRGEIPALIEVKIKPPLNSSTMPAALLPPPADLKAKFNGRQIEVLNNMRRQFVEEVGGGDQNPGSPQYQQKWEQAAEASDARYKAMYGWNAYSSMQQEALKEIGSRNTQSP